MAAFHNSFCIQNNGITPYCFVCLKSFVLEHSGATPKTASAVILLYTVLIFFCLVLIYFVILSSVTMGLVIPLWCNVSIELDGDG